MSTSHDCSTFFPLYLWNTTKILLPLSVQGGKVEKLLIDELSRVCQNNVQEFQTKKMKAIARIRIIWSSMVVQFVQGWLKTTTDRSTVKMTA